MPVKSFTAVTVAALLLSAATNAHGEEIITLPTRAGVTQSFLLSTPAHQPAAVAVLFPGGFGGIRLRMENGQIKFGAGNFLVRSRNFFINGGLATAIVDAPSDQAGGMADWFRLGDKHAADIAAVVAELKKRFADVPVYLVGTSRGSVSAAATGRAVGESVSGVVLTSSMYLGARSGPGLSGFDYTQIKVPVLLVHHTEDNCFWTPYREAKKLTETRQYPLISVTGGKPATSDPCEPFSAHGYLGKEAETVEAMGNWMLKKPYRGNID
jgi:pimeloyl-ACP methyl ester carboxylesterase